jgi:hypothetical protein
MRNERFSKKVIKSEKNTQTAVAVDILAYNRYLE